MAKIRFDGVVQAVRYNPAGQINWVRAYVRRGPTFSDYVLIDRQTIIDLIKSGKVFVAGERIARMASTFQVSKPLRVIQSAGKDILVTGDLQSKRDCLEGVPIL
jgi:hypothetical protein